MTRALVAGGAGFIGSHLCRELLRRGFEVVCLDNLVTGSLDNVADLEANASFRMLRADVTEAPSLAVDLVLHLASPASPVHYKAWSIETMMANSRGTHRLLDLTREAGARFVFASTSEVYGDPLEHPQKETYWGNVNPVGPRACYDESKRFGETLTMEYWRKFGLNATIVRIFNTYGPNMSVDDGRVIPAFAAAALRGEPLPVHGDGLQTRSFCYVSDLVQALLLVALDTGSAGDVFNLGNPREMTMIELAATVARCAGSEAGLRHLPRLADDPERRRPDITKVQERFGWQPHVALEEGLTATVAYFRQVLAQRAKTPD